MVECSKNQRCRTFLGVVDKVKCYWKVIQDIGQSLFNLATGVTDDFVIAHKERVTELHVRMQQTKVKNIQKWGSENLEYRRFNLKKFGSKDRAKG